MNPVRWYGDRLERAGRLCVDVPAAGVTVITTTPMGMLERQIPACRN